jgi:hypothetical protein
MVVEAMRAATALDALALLLCGAGASGCRHGNVAGETGVIDSDTASFDTDGSDDHTDSDLMDSDVDDTDTSGDGGCNARGLEVDVDIAIVNDGLSVGTYAFSTATDVPVELVDLDNDGYDDGVVGLPREADFEGVVYVYRGGAGGPDLSSPAAALRSSLVGRVGTALAVGDFDADGEAELLVNAYGRAEDEPHTAWIIEGADVYGEDPTTAAVATLEGEPSDGDGWAGTAGDVDGDGTTDLAFAGDIGSRMRLFRGPFDRSVDLTSPDAWWEEGLRSGYSNQSISVGDTNGDGSDEIGLRFLQETERGRVGVYEEPSGALDLASADFVIDSGHRSCLDDCWSGVFGIGDLDRDGYDDVAAMDDVLGLRVRLIGGGFVGDVLVDDVAGLATIEYDWPEARFGRGNANGADMDLDGNQDLFLSMGDGSHPGDVYGWYGPIEGTCTLSGAPIHAYGDALNQSEIAFGDVDGDARLDLLISGPMDDTGATNAGAAFLLLGSRF